MTPAMGKKERKCWGFGCEDAASLSLKENRFFDHTQTHTNSFLYNALSSPRKRGPPSNVLRSFLSTLLHFGWKLKNPYLGFHGSIGPAFSISNKVKPRLAIGGGLSFGKKQMLTIDVLGLGGYVNRKSEGYSTKDSYSAEPGQIVVSKLNFGWGISIGYIYKFSK